MPSLPAPARRRSAPVPGSPRPGEPLVGGNRVELIEDGTAALDAMLRAIDGASDHVNLDVCIAQADGAGEQIARHLADRCADGVRVNLLFDGARGPTPASPFFARLRRRGVSLCEHQAAPRWHTLAGLCVPAPDPRRLMVVDGRIGFIGGVHARPVRRGLHVRLEGPVVQRLQRLFIALWQRHAAAPMQQARYFRPLSPVGTHRVGVVAGDAIDRRAPGADALLDAIDAAAQRVLLATTGLAPPVRLLGRLQQAAERGVAVELLLAGDGAAWPALHAAHAPLARLLEAGARIHERPAAQCHAEACVIDGLWSGIGSSGAGQAPRSHDAEADLVVLGADFGDRLEALLRTEAAGARAVDRAAWDRRPAWRRLGAALVQRVESLF